MLREMGSLILGVRDFERGGTAMVSSVEAFQLSFEAAEVYERKFVPALFGEGAPPCWTSPAVPASSPAQRPTAWRGRAGLWVSTSTKGCSRLPGGCARTSSGSTGTRLTFPFL